MKPIESHKEEAVYVYQAPVRIWHWINAFAILALCGTGYLIGSPPPSVSGEASSSYLFGYIRFIHFVAAYTMIIGFMFRLYWSIVGNEHARQIFFPPLFSKTFWRELIHELLWYAMIVKEPKKYEGHNPLATLIMHFGFVWFSVFMIFTGLALYGEGEGMGSWQYDWFSSWLIPMFGQSQDLHTWHHLGMWGILIFIIVHIYAAIREDIMSRQSIISSMFSGWRTFRDNKSN
ncbi:Ni/Fe-hydrogenase, b-type cytochrome subunit [Rhizobium aegyptiacum]|uniref:Ni/Fe-hydrogenase, b-type cytochrome subunit n=1 Tax=Rhizobium aegyptiacum TaxID=1764550 RepID=UPI0007E59BBF|nr:Ni/Fe-hydrogenase, b-type cytochrome subunit [Rhizobium aegyptiacum]